MVQMLIFFCLKSSKLHFCFALELKSVDIYDSEKLTKGNALLLLLLFIISKKNSLFSKYEKNHLRAT